jgi:SP family sugar:H+ symporter-like MFS transporter
MADFLDRFGQRPPKEGPAFSTVRSGLIVSLVGFPCLNRPCPPNVKQLSIGTLFGALIAAPIADRIGRRLSVSFWCIIVSVGFVIQISANRDWIQVMIGRLVTGFGVGALSLLVPMYQGQCAHLSPTVVPRLNPSSRNGATLHPRSADQHLPTLHHHGHFHCGMH